VPTIKAMVPSSCRWCTARSLPAGCDRTPEWTVHVPVAPSSDPRVAAAHRRSGSRQDTGPAGPTPVALVVVPPAGRRPLPAGLSGSPGMSVGGPGCWSGC